MGTKARNKPGGGMLLLEGQCSTKVLWSAIAGELRDGGPCSRMQGILICSKSQKQKFVQKKIVQISSKRKTKENLYPLLTIRGNIVTKDEEKAEVLHAFLASVFNNKTSCCQGIQLLELEDRLGAE